MNAERLLELYEQISETQDAVARLRRFVLDLSVRGKLVEQDAGDEPATELLKKIFLEKSRLAKVGKIRKPKSLPPISDAPFDIPETWQWTRIREVTTDRGQAVPDETFTYIDVSAINKEDGVIEAPSILEASEAPSRARKITRKGDVIYSCVRPYLLNVAVVDRDIDPLPIASTAFAVINGMGFILPRYTWIVLRTPFLISCVEATQRGQSYPAINDADFAVLPFPLPPLAEQHRIVAKVDELMGLCDRLEEARKLREETRDKLTAASFARLTAPETTKAGTTDTGNGAALTTAQTIKSGFQTHARFALDTLPALTSRPDQIKTLRQAILNLAIHGKLVEQDGTDEAAIVTIRKIFKARDQLVKNRTLKKPKPTTNPISYKDEFNSPTGWSWASFGELFFVTKLAGFEYTKYFNLGDEGEVPVIRAQNVRPWNATLENLKYIPSNVSQALERSALTKDCLLVTFIGAGIGDVAHFKPDRRWHLAPNVAKAEPFEGCDVLYDLKYQTHFINSPMGRRELFKHMKIGAQPSLSMGTIRDVDIPIPPLAEQHRIVAKVDALLAICDRLEAALIKADATRTMLLKALLHEALEPASKALEPVE